MGYYSFDCGRADATCSFLRTARAWWKHESYLRPAAVSVFQSRQTAGGATAWFRKPIRFKSFTGTHNERKILMKSACTFFALIAVSIFALQSWGQQEAAQWKPVETALERTGKPQPDGAYKFSMPRKDLKVTVADTSIKAGLALGSWTAFKGNGDDAMVMGDLVLTEAEVEPVMLKLQQGGIEITALHNHVLNESPRVMYMHISGQGNAVKLARSLRDA